MNVFCFDIETTGLDAARDEVTMICTQDVQTGARKSYNFDVLSHNDESSAALLCEVVQQFEQVDSLCAFNGIHFDLPFMQQALHIHEDIITAWVLKTIDPLEFLRLSGHRTSSLDKICTHNNIPSKSSTGKEAVEMARDGRWEELQMYYEQDVAILCSLLQQRTFQHPAQETEIDLVRCMPDAWYD
jgi:DNA polymerase III alpha subunit (gram-positive type)